MAENPVVTEPDLVTAHEGNGKPKQGDQDLSEFVKSLRPKLSLDEQIKLDGLEDLLRMGPVNNFLSQVMFERAKFPPLDVPGCKKKKLAICGLASTTRMAAPFQDQEFDVWACHAGFQILPRVDVTFEVHDPGVFAKYEAPYWESLKKLGNPVFMDSRRPEFKEIPSAVNYPIQEIVDQFGRYQTNTIEYMIWLAIRQGYEFIGVFGVEMEHSTEYYDQARGVIYALGIAMGRGIQIFLPPECQLFKCRWMYAFETAQRDEDTHRVEKFRAQMNAELAQAQNQMVQAQQRFFEAKGRVEAGDVIHRRILQDE